MRNRRQVLAGAGAVALASGGSSCWNLGGPRPPAGDYLARQASEPAVDLIDMHAHTFNAADLPAIRFIRFAFLHLYREDEEFSRLSGIEDPDLIDGLLDLVLSVVGAGQAPTAREEIAFLEKAEKTLDGPLSDVGRMEEAAKAERAYIDDVDAYLRPVTEGAMPPDAQRKRAKVVALVREAAGSGSTNEAGGSEAARAYRSDGFIGRMLRWVGLFRRYRFQLVDELDKRHKVDGSRLRMVSPALVDYAAWLQEETVDSNLPDQIRVMEKIARLSTGTLVHPYAPFDPLRLVYRRHGPKKPTLDVSYNPLDLATDAIKTRGFIGVKIYPPMGFRPLGNAALTASVCAEAPTSDPVSPFPPAIMRDIGPNLGLWLDEALTDLFSECDKVGACVIAHGDKGNASYPCYDLRGDPAHWLAVFERWPSLRVNLAHFGRFWAISVTAPGNSVAPENSWEWTFGRWIKERPKDAPISQFMDLSYLAEMLKDNNPARDIYAAHFRRFIKEFDPECRRLLFGTDWVMVGREANSERFDSRVLDFLKSDCRLSDDLVRRIRLDNPRAYLGIAPGQKHFERLKDFYRNDPSALDRLMKLASL